MKKKILTLLLACVLATGTIVGPVGMETVQAWDEDEDEYEDENGIRYDKYVDEGIRITGYSGKEENLVIPESINIDGVDIPVVRIEGSFRDLNSLVSVTIPKSVIDIGIEIGSFSGCNKLEKFIVKEGNPVFEADEAGVLYNKGKTCLVSCPQAKQEVHIPDTVTEIGYDAFSGCSNLTSITIPNSVTQIDVYAFKGCSNLTSITIPNSVTTVYVSAFEDCSNLTSITIPSSVTNQGGGRTFHGCSKLEKIIVEEGSPVYEVDEAGVLYNKGKTTLICCPRQIKQVRIPNSVTLIDNSAFEDCSSLVSLTIPDSVLNVGLFCFAGCSSLKIYYGGSQEQWNQWWDRLNQIVKDTYRNLNSYLGLGESVEIYYDSIIPEDPQPGDTPQTPEQPGDTPQTSEQPGDTPQTPETPQKSDQTITAKDVTKTYGAKAFSLNAKVNTNTTLTYASSDKKVATVDKNGKVTIKGCGITNITITAPATDAYNQATKTVKLTVKPKKATLSSVKSTKKKTATVKWKKDAKASGYIIQCATDSKFKKNKAQVTVSKNKTVSSTVKKLKAGKKYYVRVCAYAKSDKTKVQGDWSKAKTVKVKK